MKKLFNVFIFLGLLFSNNMFSQIEKKKFEYKKDKEENSFKIPKEYDIYYNQVLDKYVLREKFGKTNFGEPIILSKEEYINFVLSGKIKDYYLDKSRANDEAYKQSKKKDKDQFKDVIGVLPTFKIKSKLFERIFGGESIEFLPSGFASFDLGIFNQFIDNPNVLPVNRRNFSIDINQKIQFGINGKIGKRLSIGANYDTQAGFGFENRLNLAWTSDEDNILQKIEVGNVNFPLSTSLIPGVQSLFGVRTDFKIGNTKIATVFSNQQSQTNSVQVQGNDVVNSFKINVVDYDLNQHYLIGQYFRNRYTTALSQFPIINSAINITKIEVWKIDYTNSDLTNQRSIIGLRDLGEENASINPPKNGTVYNQVKSLGSGITNFNTARNIINGSVINGEPYVDGEHFVVQSKVRKLNESEYKLNPQTGFISLVQPLDDKELLGVAYQYSEIGTTKITQVGEFSTDSKDLLVVKLLKSNSLINTTSPLWNLMMKNIYSIENARNISPQNFIFNVKYQSPSNGAVEYFPSGILEKKRFLNEFNLDKLNANNQATSNLRGDGFFDFVPGITIIPDLGKIIFTQLEPFGTDLETKIPGDTNFIFNDLYDKQKIEAKANPLANRYFFDGRYKGEAGGAISLGSINVAKGSVVGTADGKILTEGSDYIVDYQLGSVTIINEVLKNSTTPITFNVENNALFNVQKKSFFGINAEHKFSENLLVGLTFANYGERPLTQKAQFGVESLNNTMLGTNINWQTEAPILSRISDFIPFARTQGKSNFQLNAEGAFLIPGTKNTIEDQSYIDDFESSQSKINLKNTFSWKLASTPKFNPLFPNGNSITNNLQNVYERGLMSWYEIDPSFYSLNQTTISQTEINLNSSRRVDIKEIFNNRQLDINNPTYLNTFDLSFFPLEKGPYNFNTAAELPQNRWAGISSPLSITNFENSNIQYLEFWMMDPFSDGAGSPGELLVHLGNISEDILYDNNMLYENGLVSDATPTNQVNTTNFGVQPSELPIQYAFTTQGESRIQQDVGLDGLNDQAESLKFGTSFINPIKQQNDPSNDNFISYLDPVWRNTSLGNSLINRYKYFQGTDGNSPTDPNIQSNFIPDSEDLNQDFNLDTSEAYYEFKVKINSADFNTIGNNYIVDKKNTIVTLPNGSTASTNWYQFRIPVNQGTAIGGISNLSSIRYMRMIMRGFSSQTTLRFGTLDLVRGDWAPFTKNLFPNINLEGTVNQPIDDFEVSVANIEENGRRNPPYVLPPGITRENLSSTSTATLQQNEQSLSLRVKNLSNDSRGVFKKGNYDFRRYNKLNLFVHAENLDTPSSSNIDPDMKVFIRVGTDLVDNYYEYETNLTYTASSALSAGEIWPNQNQIEIVLQDLIAAKNERDRQPNLSALILQRFSRSTSETNKTIYVKGRPSLGLTSNIMIGIRNTGSNPKNVLVWVNELRMSGIDKKGGYAGRANLNFNLADLANFNITGNYTSSGFGGITQTTIQRSLEEQIGYSISSNINLEKFFPQKWNLILPMALSYSKNLINPEFNPIDSDIKFKDISNAFVKEAIQQVQTSKSIAFPSIKKLPSVDKSSSPTIFDLENFSSAFSYSETRSNDIQIQSNLTKDLSLSLDYNFSPTPLEIRPFAFLFNRSSNSDEEEEVEEKNKENIKKVPEKETDNALDLDKTRFKWIRDFNINPKPSNFSLRSQINRNYNQIDFRDVSALLNNSFTTVPIATTFGNRFVFNIVGSAAFNLTKSFNLNYQVNNNSLVNNNLQDANENIIWKDLLNTGKPVDHAQTFTAAYVVPTNYFFNMDWTTLDFNYTGTYNWRNNSQLLADANLGFIIQNNSNLSSNLAVDFNKLYYKFFKKVKSEFDSISTSRTTSIQEFNTKLQNAKSTTAYNSLIKKAVKFNSFYKPQHYLYRLFTSIKNVSVNHKLENGSTLPGFLLEPSFLGLTNTIPSLSYVIGSDFDFKKRAIEQGWVTTSNLLTTPYARTHSQSINASLLIEPIANSSINLTFNNTYSESGLQSGFNDPSIGNKVFNNQLVSYNTSYLSIGSAFNRGTTFTNFISVAQTVSKKLGTIDTDNDGFTDGYNLTNAAVLIPAFRNAVNGKSTSTNGLKYKNTIPLPNWAVTYAGLNNIPWFMKRFSQIDLTHAYQSNYVINGIQSNPNFYAFENGTLPPATNGANNRLDINGNFHNQFLYQEISVTESFSPLLGIDLKLRNNLQFSTKYNRNRITTLGLTNFSITEDFLDDFVLGVGYTFKDVKLNLNFGKGKNKYKGDILLRTDFSFMRKQAKIFNFLTNSENILNDQDLVAIKLTSEFNPTKNLSFRLFYDQLLTKYRISTLFSSNITRAGVSITFNILNTTNTN